MWTSVLVRVHDEDTVGAGSRASVTQRGIGAAERVRRLRQHRPHHAGVPAIRKSDARPSAERFLVTRHRGHASPYGDAVPVWVLHDVIEYSVGAITGRSHGDGPADAVFASA